MVIIFFHVRSEICTVRQNMFHNRLLIAGNMYRGLLSGLSLCFPSFHNTKITEAKSTKELYHITNSISARTKCTQLPTTFLLSDLPNLFSEFFQNKISKIRSDLDSQTCTSHSLSKPFSGVPLLSFMPDSEKTCPRNLEQISPQNLQSRSYSFFSSI